MTHFRLYGDDDISPPNSSFSLTYASSLSVNSPLLSAQKKQVGKAQRSAAAETRACSTSSSSLPSSQPAPISLGAATPTPFSSSLTSSHLLHPLHQGHGLKKSDSSRCATPSLHSSTKSSSSQSAHHNPPPHSLHRASSLRGRFMLSQNSLGNLLQKRKKDARVRSNKQLEDGGGQRYHYFTEKIPLAETTGAKMFCTPHVVQSEVEEKNEEEAMSTCYDKEEKTGSEEEDHDQQHHSDCDEAEKLNEQQQHVVLSENSAGERNGVETKKSVTCETLEEEQRRDKMDKMGTKGNVFFTTTLQKSGGGGVSDGGGDLKDDGGGLRWDGNRRNTGDEAKKEVRSLRGKNNETRTRRMKLQRTNRLMMISNRNDAIEAGAKKARELFQLGGFPGSSSTCASSGSPDDISALADPSNSFSGPGIDTFDAPSSQQSPIRQLTKKTTANHVGGERGPSLAPHLFEVKKQSTGNGNEQLENDDDDDECGIVLLGSHHPTAAEAKVQQLKRSLYVYNSPAADESSGNHDDLMTKTNCSDSEEEEDKNPSSLVVTTNDQPNVLSATTTSECDTESAALSTSTPSSLPSALSIPPLLLPIPTTSSTSLAPHTNTVHNYYQHTPYASSDTCSRYMEATLRHFMGSIDIEMGGAGGVCGGGGGGNPGGANDNASDASDDSAGGSDGLRYTTKYNKGKKGKETGGEAGPKRINDENKKVDGGGGRASKKKRKVDEKTAEEEEGQETEITTAAVTRQILRWWLMGGPTRPTVKPAAAASQSPSSLPAAFLSYRRRCRRKDDVADQAAAAAASLYYRRLWQWAQWQVIIGRTVVPSSSAVSPSASVSTEGDGDVDGDVDVGGGDVTCVGGRQSDDHEHRIITTDSEGGSSPCKKKESMKSIVSIKSIVRKQVSIAKLSAARRRRGGQGNKNGQEETGGGCIDQRTSSQPDDVEEAATTTTELSSSPTNTANISADDSSIHQNVDTTQSQKQNSTKIRILVLLQRLRELRRVQLAKEAASRRIRALHSCLLPPATALLCFMSSVYLAVEQGKGVSSASSFSTFSSSDFSSFHSTHSAPAMASAAAAVSASVATPLPEELDCTHSTTSSSGGGTTTSPQDVADYCGGPLRQYISCLFDAFITFSRSTLHHPAGAAVSIVKTDTSSSHHHSCGHGRRGHSSTGTLSSPSPSPATTATQTFSFRRDCSKAVEAWEDLHGEDIERMLSLQKSHDDEKHEAKRKKQQTEGRVMKEVGVKAKGRTGGRPKAVNVDSADGRQQEREGGKESKEKEAEEGRQTRRNRQDLVRLMHLVAEIRSMAALLSAYFHNMKLRNGSSGFRGSNISDLQDKSVLSKGKTAKKNTKTETGGRHLLEEDSYAARSEAEDNGSECDTESDDDENNKTLSRTKRSTSRQRKRIVERKTIDRARSEGRPASTSKRRHRQSVTPAMASSVPTPPHPLEFDHSHYLHHQNDVQNDEAFHHHQRGRDGREYYNAFFHYSHEYYLQGLFLLEPRAAQHQHQHQQQTQKPQQSGSDSTNDQKRRPLFSVTQQALQRHNSSYQQHIRHPPVKGKINDEHHIEEWTTNDIRRCDLGGHTKEGEEEKEELGSERSLLHGGGTKEAPTLQSIRRDNKSLSPPPSSSSSSSLRFSDVAVDIVGFYHYDKKSSKKNQRTDRKNMFSSSSFIASENSSSSFSNRNDVMPLPSSSSSGSTCPVEAEASSTSASLHSSSFTFSQPTSFQPHLKSPSSADDSFYHVTDDGRERESEKDEVPIHDIIFFTVFAWLLRQCQQLIHTQVPPTPTAVLYERYLVHDISTQMRSGETTKPHLQVNQHNGIGFPPLFPVFSLVASDFPKADENNGVDHPFVERRRREDKTTTSTRDGLVFPLEYVPLILAFARKTIMSLSDAASSQISSPRMKLNTHLRMPMPQQNQYGHGKRMNNNEADRPLRDERRGGGHRGVRGVARLRGKTDTAASVLEEQHPHLLNLFKYIGGGRAFLVQSDFERVLTLQPVRLSSGVTSSTSSTHSSRRAAFHRKDSDKADHATTSAVNKDYEWLRKRMLHWLFPARGKPPQMHLASSLSSAVVLSPLVSTSDEEVPDTKDDYPNGMNCHTLRVLSAISDSRRPNADDEGYINNVNSSRQNHGTRQGGDPTKTQGHTSEEAAHHQVVGAGHTADGVMSFEGFVQLLATPALSY